jgi:hypothetical protein
MRRPMSSDLRREALQASVKCWIVGHSILPTAPDDLDPRTSQDPGGVGWVLVFAALGSDVRPRRLPATSLLRSRRARLGAWCRCSRETRRCASVRSGESKELPRPGRTDSRHLGSGLDSHRSRPARWRRERLRRGQRREDPPVGVGFELLGDMCGEFVDLVRTLLSTSTRASVTAPAPLPSSLRPAGASPRRR